MEKNGFTINPTSGNMNGVVQVSCGQNLDSAKETTITIKTSTKQKIVTLKQKEYIPPQPDPGVQEVFNDIKQIAINTFDLTDEDFADVTMDTELQTIIETFGLTSLDLTDFIVELESYYTLSIGPEIYEDWVTIGDMVHYIASYI